jgi:hypothetical protein
MAQKTFGSTIDPDVIEFTRIVSRALVRARRADKRKDKVNNSRVNHGIADKQKLPDP